MIQLWGMNKNKKNSCNNLCVNNCNILFLHAHFVALIQWLPTDPECADLKAIQLVQNKLLRHLNGTKVSDKISTESLLKKFGMFAVNQLNAQAKLLEIWKAQNVPNYPLELKQQSQNHDGAITRADIKEKICDIGRSTIAKKTCISDAIKLWNQAPEAIHLCKSLYQAKAEIKKYIISLPI